VVLSTYAGLAAVTAVWFAILDSFLPRNALRAGAITSLAASITLNAAIISRTIMTGRAIPVARVLFTLLLLTGLLTTIRQDKE
jgi:hypothetical protein